MVIKTRLLGVFLCTAGLTSCMSYNPNGYMNHQSYIYKSEPIYPESYDDYSSYRYYSPNEPDVVKKAVEVPDTYHVGPTKAPISHKDQDKGWAVGQNPQRYTIELADDPKPSQVANKLYQAPKNERMGQIKYEKSGETYYKGLYGSYDNYESAQKALNNLPPDVKDKATITNWGSVQNTISE